MLSIQGKTMRGISAFIVRLSSLKTFIPLLIIFLAFEIVLFPGVSKEIDKLNQKEFTKIPDIQFGFSAESFYNIINSMNMPAQAYYYKVELTLDLIFPFVYGVMFSFLISLLFFNKDEKPANYWLNLLPLVAMMFDYGENIFIAKLLRIYPIRSPIYADAAGLCNVLKWTFLFLVIVICIIGIYRLIRNKKSEQQ